MSPELQFQVANFAALPFWALMVIAPGWWLTRRMMETFLGPALFAGVYAAFVVPMVPAVLPHFLRPELGAIMRLMSDPQAFVIGWIHYLAFDLFVGRWEYLDAGERGVSHWLLAPCLVLTLLFGPLGLATYLVARLFARRPAPPASA